MFDHVKFGVSNFEASRAFYLKVLAPLNIKEVSWGASGVELVDPHSNSSLCLFQTDEKPALLHIAFIAQNRQQVHDFHRLALEAGAKDNGPPGLRPQYHANYYAAFVIDPDGHNIEMLCSKPQTPPVGG